MNKQISDIHGNLWTESETKYYYQISAEIDRIRNSDTREFLLDQRHKFYLHISECYRLGIYPKNKGAA